jgi:hypothetical protein
MVCTEDIMANQNIDIGSQPNDGTGDSIFTAFQKVNANFQEIYSLLGFGAGFSFLRLKEAPSVLQPNAILQVNSVGTKFLNKTLVAGTGMNIVLTTSTIEIVNTASSISSDKSPALAANLSGEGAFSLINMDITGPNADWDAVSRKWIYENFVNRDGITVYDTTSTSELDYFGRSVIRDNVSIADDLAPTSSTHLVSKGYVDDLVDNSAYASKVNFYVSLAGDDNRFDLPSWKRGRANAYAFKTINRAARAAEQYIASSQIVLGPYQKTISYSEGTKRAQVTEITASTILDPASFGIRLRVDLDAASKNIGTDPFINRSIFPGNYLIGARSESVGLIETITLDPINGYEYYDVTPVDYAKTYRVDLYPVNLLDLSAVKFNLGLSDNIDLPDFWIGQKFTVANTSNNVIAYGTISNITTVLDASGNVRDSLVVDFTGGVAITTTATITENYWHVYSADYELGEELQWGQKQNKNQCTILVESGEFDDQYPIKVPENCSIKGDEFRRSIIKPAPLFGTRLPGISQSKWANTYFFRDVQVDGIIVTQLNTSTDYALSKIITIDAINNDAVTDVVTVTVKDGTPAPLSYVGKIFKTSGAVDAQGEIRSVIGNTFFVSLAQNNRYLKQVDNYTVNDDIASGTWHIYDPIEYGYHYLRDASRPVNLLTTVTNEGGFNLSALRLEENADFIAEEAFEFMKDIYEIYINPLSFNETEYKRDLKIIVNSLAYDLRNGGNIRTINAGDSYKNAAPIKTGWTSTATAAAINYIDSIGQLIIDNDPVTPTRGSEFQVSILGDDEHPAGPILADLVQACRRIFLGDAAFNPPKYNDQMDVFLMNDATINRYISAQGHGGFMKVLDPDGQILAKSPYTQTASSFSKSYNRQVFSGGMFIDGFAGNTVTLPASITNDSNGNPVKINITTPGGLGRPSIVPGEGYIKPQVPCFFVHKGVTFEVSFIGEWDPTNGTGSLNINPLRPGGIASVTGVTATGFKTGSTITVPVRFSAPTQSGGLNSTGTAVINSAGAVTAVNVSFPGSGYENGVYDQTDGNAPKIFIGGARISWSLSATGSINGYTVIDGGAGYAAGTVISFPAAGGGTTATAVVATVDGIGAIQTVTVTNSGTNYQTDPAVTFGAGLAYTATVKPGFNVTAAHPLPAEITLITAGNRSMLANDFTQINDLGYGIFCTNGGLVENVSMFTYYCYSAYYSLNGGQCRSVAGSTSYGITGLKSEGSDPNEVPIAIRNKFPMTQVALVNSTGAFVNRTDDFTIYVDGTTYEPQSQSQLEINHSGIVKLYNVKSAVLVDTGVYSLSIDDGTGKGLLAAVSDNTPVIIRIYFNQLLLDVNAATLSRPSTVLTYAEDPSYVYRILQYTDKGADTAIAEGDTPYNYVLMTPYTEGGLYRQGLGQITITSGGSGYSTGTQYAAIIPAPSTAGSATIAATQTNTDLVTITGAAGTIMIGSRVNYDSDAGGPSPIGDPGGAPMYVVWVNDAQTQIRVDREFTWAAGSSLTFTGTQAVGYGIANSSGQIDQIVLTNQGAGYAGTGVRNITFATGGATATAYADGIAGTKVIKITEISSRDESRIETGLANGYSYTFAYEGEIYKIVSYKNPLETFNDWAEVTVERLSDGAALQTNVIANTLKAGITANQPGEITVRISTMRVSGHDMLFIGTGGYADSKYPNDLYGPPNIPPDTSKETKEVGKGRVYYATTDQDGNFKIGKYFSVDQGRGTVSISAPISLTNVDGISFRRGQTLVQVFSVDGTMGNNSNNSVPTERAVASYVNNRLGLNKNNTIAGVTPIGSGFLDRGGVLDMKANIKMDTNRVTDMGDPVDDQDAITKKWAEARYVNTSGDTMVGTLNTEIVLPRLNNQYDIGSSIMKYINVHASNFKGNADTASKWLNARTVSFSGDVAGSFTIDGSTGTTATLTIQANSVALGTDTTGQYASTVGVSGVGLSCTTPSADDGTAYTITSNATNSNTVSTIVARDASGNFGAGTITAALDGNAATSSKWATARTVTFAGGDVTGSFSIDGGLDVGNIALTIEANSVALGTDTTGDYVASVAVSGTGLGVTGTGEGASVTVSSNATNANTVNTIVARDGSGNFSAGTITATFSGNLTGDVTGTASAASAVVGSLLAGTYLTGSNYNGSAAVTWTVDATDANTGGKVVARDGSGNFSAGVITATATQARYADLAEKYLPDNQYEPGTVLVFGGNSEVTVTNTYMDKRIAGVVSTNPAYMMNEGLEGGVYVALTGRVPCKVVGKIRKGDMLVSSGAPGIATADANPVLGSVIGKALQDYDGQTVGTIEVVVGRM